MDKENKKKLDKVVGEIRKAFDNWDENIKAGLKPVPIQDLDYWANQIAEVVVDEQ